MAGLRAFLSTTKWKSCSAAHSCKSLLWAKSCPRLNFASVMAARGGSARLTKSGPDPNRGQARAGRQRWERQERERHHDGESPADRLASNAQTLTLPSGRDAKIHLADCARSSLLGSSSLLHRAESADSLAGGLESPPSQPGTWEARLVGSCLEQCPSRLASHASGKDGKNFDRSCCPDTWPKANDAIGRRNLVDTSAGTARPASTWIRIDDIAWRDAPTCSSTGCCPVSTRPHTVRRPDLPYLRNSAQERPIDLATTGSGTRAIRVSGNRSDDAVKGHARGPNHCWEGRDDRGILARGRPYREDRDGDVW